MSDQQPRKKSTSGSPSEGTGKTRTNAKVACGQCRKRKSRCLGGVPCEPCVLAKTECIIDNDSDGRRRVGLKRKLEELEQDRNLLFRLLDLLRDENRHEASEVFNLIRSDAPMDELRLRVAENFGLGNTRRKFMDVNRLADIPLFRVSARPWTTVTNDDDLVSHLLSLWYTWNYPCLNFLNWTLFIRDMRSGRLDSTYCSPFLVNSILAEACFYSNYDEVFAKQGDPASRGMHFYDEAKRLLDKQEGKITLPTFEGLGAFYVCTCVIGKDRLGWMHVVQSASAARDMTSLRSHLVAGGKEESKEMIQALDNAILGMFCTTTSTAMGFQKSPLHKKPKIPRLPEDHDEKDVWTPYPLGVDSVPAHRNCLINAVTALQTIMWDVSRFFFEEDEKPPLGEIQPAVEGFYTRLEKFSQDLPECIGLGTNATPGVLDLHSRYYVTIMTVLGFLKSITPQDNSPEFIANARDIRMSSARKIRVLMNTFCIKWRIDYMPQNYMQWAVISLFTLLEDLDNHESSEAFIDLCVVVRSMGRRWLLARGMLRLVQITASQMGVELPRETDSLFRDFESELWKTQDRKQFSSLYPNFAMTVLDNDEGRTINEAELDQFLEKWDDLNLAETASIKSKSQSPAGGQAEGSGS